MGALSGALGRIQANRPLRELREIAKGVTKQLPEAFQVTSRMIVMITTVPLVATVLIMSMVVMMTTN